MVRWLGLTLAVLAACGYASYYAHMNLEESDDADQSQDTTVSRSGIRRRLVHPSEARTSSFRASPTTL
jgi:hypothetical protein